jgi:hypothetical protein
MLAEGSGVAFRAGVPRLSHSRLEPSARLADDAPGHLSKKGLDRMYRAMGYVHARVGGGLAAWRRTAGQGTVEYVALILLVALVMAGVVAAMKGFKTDEGRQLGDVILDKLKQAVRRVEF